jgi:anti-anti-sigma factor
MMSSRHLQVTRNEDVFLVHFLDRQLAGALPEELGGELYSVAAQEGCTKILLSFSGVDFLASDMLGKVVVLNKKMKQKGGNLTLCEVCPCIRQILATTKLDTIIPVKGTEAEGLTACACRY